MDMDTIDQNYSIKSIQIRSCPLLHGSAPAQAGGGVLRGDQRHDPRPHHHLHGGRLQADHQPHHPPLRIPHPHPRPRQGRVRLEGHRGHGVELDRQGAAVYLSISIYIYIYLSRSIYAGKEDPQKPQMFYPVEDSAMTLTGGDTVAARCTMVSYRDRITWVTNIFSSPRYFLSLQIFNVRLSGGGDC